MCTSSAWHSSSSECHMPAHTAKQQSDACSLHQAAHQHPRLPVCFTLAMDTTESDTCSKISWACASSMMAALAGAQRAAMQAHVAASRACRRVTVTFSGLTACLEAELLVFLGAQLHLTENLSPL